MALIAKKVRGAEDILPKDIYKWQFVENIIKEESKLYGYKEIRTPVFEHTELFARGVGETTDVVQKEMYTFETRGGDSITLRPEGTAGSARAFLEHALYNDGFPTKVSYFVSCYRYENPQAGRQREFNQFGLETYGTSSPSADAELICAANSIFNRLQLKDLRLELNSIGCPKCREKYIEKLKEYYNNHREELCETCADRIDVNPLRVLDCKNPICIAVNVNAPKILEFLCEECDNHFEKVKKHLDLANVEYIVNPKIVRGLDYYTKTVFEFITDSIGAQGTVCGGGRYDGLIEEIGGQPTPSLGFALGMERLLMVMESQNIEIPKPKTCDIYIGSIGDEAQNIGFNLAKDLRTYAIYPETDIVGRGIRAQMKHADRINAKFSMVLGDNEIKDKKAKVRNMKTGEEFNIILDNSFAKSFIDIYITEEDKFTKKD